MEEIQFVPQMNEAQPESPFSARRSKYALLTWVFAATVVSLMVSIAFPTNIYVANTITFVLIFVYGLGIYSWCKIDSKERGRHLTKWFPYLVILFGTLTLVCYFFRSRGLLGGIKALLLFLSLVLAMLFIDVVIGTIAVILISLITKVPKKK